MTDDEDDRRRCDICNTWHDVNDRTRCDECQEIFCSDECLAEHNTVWHEETS